MTTPSQNLHVFHMTSISYYRQNQKANPLEMDLDSSGWKCYHWLAVFRAETYHLPNRLEWCDVLVPDVVVSPYSIGSVDSMNPAEEERQS
jgi:hypothetical protein